MPDRMSEYMSDRMPERLPNSMSEYMSDRMPQYRLCIYIYNIIYIPYILRDDMSETMSE